MKADKITETIKIPEGIQTEYTSGMLTVKGSKGEIVRKLHAPIVGFTVESGKITLNVDKPSKKEKAVVGSFKAHIKNMIKGVEEGFTYKLKICAGHFPMNVSVSNDTFTVKNFLGEKVPRVLKLRNDATVKVEGEYVVVTALDKEVAGQTAANIEQLTVVKNKDRRIFQDGIFITEKNEKRIG